MKRKKGRKFYGKKAKWYRMQFEIPDKQRQEPRGTRQQRQTHSDRFGSRKEKSKRMNKTSL